MAKGTGGRTFKTEEDLKKLKELMRLKPSLEDTAAFFECSKTTVEDAIRHHYDLTFREFREQNMVHTRLMLVRTAIQKAKSGDNTMLIFCLKNICKWADKYEQEVDVTSGGNSFTLNYKLLNE